MGRGKARYAVAVHVLFLLHIPMFMCVHRVIVTRLVSAAGTGYFYTIKKPRIKDRMTLMKYDPVGMLVISRLQPSKSVVSPLLQ